MRHARENASKRILSARVCLSKQAPRAPLCAGARIAQNWRSKRSTACTAACNSWPTLASSHGNPLRRGAFFDLAEAMVQGCDELAPPLGIVEQVVLQVGIAVNGPRYRPTLHRAFVADRPVRRSLRRLSSTSPGGGPEQPNHDLAVRQRGVVVGNLAAKRDSGSFSIGCRAAASQFCDGVHVRTSFTQVFSAQVCVYQAARGAVSSHCFSCRYPRVC